jgi:nucleoside triphosphate diphosphatase
MTGERCEKRPGEQAVGPDPVSGPASARPTSPCCTPPDLETAVASPESDPGPDPGPETEPDQVPDSAPAAAPGSDVGTAGPADPPSGFPPSPGTLDRALTVVRYLRRHCEWDRRQTAQTLVRHLLEEAAETAEAIESGDPDQLRDELGDLLLNLAFQVVVAEEARHFSAEGVIRSLESKMVRRHPHLFGLGEPESWESIKARERAGRDPADPAPGAGAPAEGASDGPGSTDPAPPPDALDSAFQVQARAAAVGFDWEEVGGALDKTREELDEVGEALALGEAAGIREEIGDLLFSVVNVARLAGLHPGDALAAATEKFTRRFAGVERLARARGLSLPHTSLEALDALWNEVKKQR